MFPAVLAVARAAVDVDMDTVIVSSTEGRKGEFVRGVVWVELFVVYGEEDSGERWGSVIRL